MTENFLLKPTYIIMEMLTQLAECHYHKKINSKIIPHNCLLTYFLKNKSTKNISTFCKSIKCLFKLLLSLAIKHLWSY